jgi:hypothetical protein
MPRTYRQVVDWVIDYYAMNRADSMDRIGLLERTIKHGGSNYRLVNLIPALRFDWQFPQAGDIQPKTDVAGSVPVGIHHVRVSGIDLCGIESAASVAQDVTLGTGQNAIRVQLQRVPYSRPFFTGYRVYVDGHLEARIPELTNSGPYYPETLIKSLLGTGTAPYDPDSTLRVHWKYLRVTGWAASHREDEVKNGVFTSNISLQTSVEQEHPRVHVPLIEEVSIATTITPPDGAFTITVGAAL